MTTATYSFLPWVRQGAATAIRDEDPIEDLIPPSSLTLGLRLNTSDDLEVPLRLHGPGDVVGIDQRQVIRTEPPRGANNFPPVFLPAVEFDRPDFPWLFTPARAEVKQGRLRPWLCLIVVEKQEGVTLRAGDPLPVLEIRSPASPADELPDLEEAWAWVHSQVVHAEDADPGAVLAAEPAKNVSRLLCPRRLKPHASYHACLVPTFEAGRRAGLGLSVGQEDEAGLQPAWGSGSLIEIRLPVYFHWTFSTGQEGDFESVVRRLRAVELPDGVGARRLFVGDAGVSALPDLGTFDYAGVFRPPSFDSPILPDTIEGDRKKWVDQMTAWLNMPDDLARGGTTEAVVTPPIYGHYQQALRRVPPGSGWLRDLNLDARNRAAAGLGVLFVQFNQEELMASAWDQLGELRQVRQLVQRTELAREVGKATFAKQFAPASDRGDLLYQMTAPSHARVRLDDEQTVAGWARAHQLPQPTTAATFRRIARPNGPVARHFRDATPSLAGPIAVRHAVTGATTPRAVQPAIAPVDVRVQELNRLKEAWLQGGTSDQEAGRRAASAIDAFVDYMRNIGADEKTTADSSVSSSTRVRMTVSSTIMTVASLASSPEGAASTAATPVSFRQKESLLQRLDPEFTLRRRLQKQLQIDDPASGDGAPPPTDVRAYPQFAQPMYEAVRELMPELLLAGAHRLPPDSVTVLETNPQFIESFLIGANHEMARELLWRGYPTDLQGTYFRHFWGAAAAVNQARDPDVPELHRWDPGRRLGDHIASGDVGGQLALVIRGELLRRFPDTVIYAVKSTPSGNLESGERYPLQRGVLLEDAVFLLFDLTQEEAVGGSEGDGGPGYFFVIQQQPSAPRFGLDESSESSAPTTWNDLAWPHVAVSPGGYVHVRASSAAVGSVNEPDGPVWGFNGAHMADILLQRPFRVAIHARLLL